MNSLDTLIEAYLRACAVEGKSAETVSSYRASLGDFYRTSRVLGLPDRVSGYEVEHVYSFLSAVRDRGASAAYRHRRHREVRAFFQWCVRMEHVQQNVFARVRAIRLEDQLVRPFAPAEILQLLSALDRSEPHGNRSYAIILFLLDTGVRASECISVDLEDVDWSSRTVRVLHGKGGKQRLVAFSEGTEAALADYMQRVRGDGPGRLFIGTREGRPIKDAHALGLILKRLGTAAGVQHVHPHRFRHTFATWAIAAHAREIDVQKLLGHSTVTMTQRYARTYASEQAVLAHPTFSPVAQLLAG